MKNALAPIVVLLATACASGGGETEGIVDFDARLEPSAGRTEHGTARAVAAIGSTAITVQLEGGTPGAVHPWHVHRGGCGSGGGIVGDADDYTALALDDDGEDREVATIDVQLVDDDPYHVNVHLSPDALGTVIACGELED